MFKGKKYVCIHTHVHVYINVYLYIHLYIEMDIYVICMYIKYFQNNIQETGNISYFQGGN